MSQLEEFLSSWVYKLIEEGSSYHHFLDRFQFIQGGIITSNLKIKTLMFWLPTYCFN